MKVGAQTPFRKGSFRKGSFRKGSDWLRDDYLICGRQNNQCGLGMKLPETIYLDFHMHATPCQPGVLGGGESTEVNLNTDRSTVQSSSNTPTVCACASLGYERRTRLRSRLLQRFAQNLQSSSRRARWKNSRSPASTFIAHF